MAGQIVETAVISEITKSLIHRGMESRLWFWRTQRGHEVDLLVEHGGRLVPVEVKSSLTPRPRMADSIHELRKMPL
jgi:hypothetical protein